MFIHTDICLEVQLQAGSAVFGRTQVGRWQIFKPAQE